jgi:hypothetical protein
MDETFERVTERHGKVEVPVRHLYRRQYQTATGDWRTIYYGIFTDWKGSGESSRLAPILMTHATSWGDSER